MQCDTVWTNCRLLARAGQPLIDNGMIAAKDGRIVHAGPAMDFEAPAIDLGGRLVTPGLIDCHTHLVFAGNRAHEFKLRLDGATYEEIARAGGGILSTVTATRAASEDELITAALPRLDALIASGVSTIEIKSGYGLTLEDELKMLRAAKALERRRPVRVMTTLLGAHALPPEYKDRPDAYIDAVCHEMIPAVVGLASAVDVFCEGIGFSPAQTERVFQAAKAHGLAVKLHAEQLSNLHGAALAARYGALSADHLEHLDADGIEAMRDAGTVATLLPGAFYFMRETYLPPIEGLRAENVPMAIATDCNPGTSPLTSILMAMNMAATCFRLTIDECLAGVTTNAAQALGRDDIGALEAGKWCDFAVWDCEQPADLVYFMGASPLHSRVFNSKVFWGQTL
ncbi:imidazolonepropionase [Asticcacaulis taihuensis]|uniref:imidazolonepropionase n=1 Tax=Asticcacaulis taihuensis TaxID=260084 RepID=UPI0026EEEB6A|nr:imidazolonepropionase [Asticcacaulis taihuensis]